MLARRHTAQLDTEGLTDECRPALVRFGRRGTGTIFQAHSLDTMVDPASKLLLFDPSQVFTRPPVYIGFGTPNTYLVVPDENGSLEKLSAFMFWRDRAAVVTGKRFQAGVLFELLGLPNSKIEELRAAMKAVEGQRSASCAHLNAAILAAAGFTFGNGRPLTRGAYRPSKFASLLWRHGLSYVDDGRTVRVSLRVIHATPKPFGDHFVGVWMREADSLKRTVEKQLAKKRGKPAPVSADPFTPRQLPCINTDRWQGPTVEVGIAQSSQIGAHFAFLVGQKPLYTVRLPELASVAALEQPLPPFPAINDKVTWLKRHILFSRPVIHAINKARVAGVDWYENTFTAAGVIDMLAPSPSADYQTATLYNCIVTSEEIRLTGLHTREPRDQSSKFIHRLNWVAAKHVLLSDYDPNVVYACELWAYRDDRGLPVLCINNNSGTYKPSMERMEAYAAYLRETFGVQVRTFPM